MHVRQAFAHLLNVQVSKIFMRLTVARFYGEIWETAWGGKLFLNAVVKQLSDERAVNDEIRNVFFVLFTPACEKTS